MKSLVILRGLVKSDKLNWILKEKLDNFYVDIDSLRRLYYKPDLSPSGREILTRSRDNLIYEHFIKIVCHRLDTGCLVVVDMSSESVGVLETLAIVYGYTIFYKTFEVPDNILTIKKGLDPNDLREKVSEFKGKDLSGGVEIESYSDIEKYWRTKKSKFIKSIPKESRILHISDLHSNWELMREFKDLNLTVYHGDYIDGPEKGGSRKIMDLVTSEPPDNVVYLEGNHELRLRKFLGSSWLWGSKRTLAKILQDSIPEDFLNRTAPDFKDIVSDPSKSREYLLKMNENLQEYVIIWWGKETIYCTHSGLRSLDQISPKYIGTVMYGSRNIDRVDFSFSENYKKKRVWSIHAHCQYPNKWEPFKYRKVINLDPSDENSVNFLLNQIGKKKLYTIRRK